MPAIHPTAIMQGEVRLADDVTVGPYCIINGPVTVGPRCALIGHVHLNGPLTMGAGNVCYPFVCLGYAPQSVSYDANTPGRGLEIGDGNTFREGVSIHRAMTDHGPTTIGSRNMFMAYSHAGHDCIVGNDCIFANGALLAGHVTVGDRVIAGGTATVHQFCRVGQGAMLSGSMGLTMDLPPHFMLTGTNICGAVNVVGLRRSGMSTEQIDAVKWVYRTLYREGRSPTQALEALRSRGDEPLVRLYIEFIEQSKRNICPARGKPARGVA